MNRTSEFEALTVTRGPPRPRIYSPLDDATSLITKINKMKTHLSKYGHDYLNTYGCLPGASMMSDDWRKKLDRDVEDFINVCNDKVNLLNQEIMLGTDSDQVIEYRKAVIQIVMRIMNEFVSHSTQLRNIRMRRNYVKEKYDRVQCNIKQVSAVQEYESISNNTKDSVSSSRDKLNSLMEEDEEDPSRPIRLDDFEQHSQLAAQLDIDISPSDVKTLLVENSRIHDELVTLNDEVKTIGKKVVQISRLQELFTEKVMEQEMELNNLHEVAIASSENVREGNELIREAMMKNASTRVFILFYIITLGFTILFLDWYNP